jgi:hypothetical protein
MAGQVQRSGGCPRLLPRAQVAPGSAPVYALAQCVKYNITTPRGIPAKGEDICARPDSGPVNCWMDLRACRKAEIARRAYERSFVGLQDPQGDPEVFVAMTDQYGREYYCLQHNGRCVHDGDHDFPMGMR